MSLCAWFERHKDVAKQHEENARMWLNDLPQTALPEAGVRDTGDQRVARKAVQCALTQQRLVVREYSEAARLRPRDAETKICLKAARKALADLESSLQQPQQHFASKWLRRFVAHYNLSVRYWDLGKASQAIAEARCACEDLKAANCDLGCAEHNLAVMSRVQASFRTKEKSLANAISRIPEAVGPTYELGILYFDKRMLLKAEEQLTIARDRARAACALQLVGTDKKRLQLRDAVGSKYAWLDLTLEDPKPNRMGETLGDIEDDLLFLAGLRQHWCAEEEAVKAEELQETGVRDDERPHLLPCLKKRFSQECQGCDQWWSELYKFDGANSRRQDLCAGQKRRQQRCKSR